MSRTYATEADFQAWLGEPAPPGAARLLRDASLEVDDMLLTAVYNVDHDDLPTDPKVAAALRDATCAQAAHRDEYGDDVTIALSGEGVQLGPLRFNGAGAGAAGASTAIPRFAPAAYRALRVAGLIPGTVQDASYC